MTDIIVNKVVGIVIEGAKVYFDDPETFVKMLDDMRDAVINDLPNWNTKQLVFVIDANGWHGMMLPLADTEIEFPEQVIRQ